MTDNTENGVLEHLRLIRSEIGDIKKIQGDILHRLTGLEDATRSVRYEMLTCADVDNRQQKTLDFLYEKIQKIERRLELSDLPLG
jgi:hypothetical protein